MGEEDGGPRREGVPLPCDASLCNCAAEGSASGGLDASGCDDLLDVRRGVALCEERCLRCPGDDMVVRLLMLQERWKILKSK